MLLVKNWNFFHFFVLSKIGLELMLGDVLESKEAFLDNEK